FKTYFPQNEEAFTRTQMYVLLSLAEKERKRTNIKNSMHSLVAAERAEKYRAAALQLTEALTRMGSNYWDLKSDYAYLKDLADALEKAGESDHAAEVLDKAALGFRSFEEVVSDSWKWNVSWDIARIRYDEGNVLFNLGRWDDAVAVFGNGLKEIDGAEQWPASPLEKESTWVFSYRSFLHKRRGIALWKKSTGVDAAEADPLKQQAIREMELAIQALKNDFPDIFKKQQAVIHEKPDEWLAQFDAAISEKLKIGTPEDVLPDEARRPEIMNLADSYEAVGHMYANTKKLEEASVSYTFAFQERYDLVARDDATAVKAHYDNETAKRNLAQILLDIGTVENNLRDDPDTAVKFFKNCIA